MASSTVTESLAERAYRRRWLVLAVVLAAECMDLIDSTVVNVAAPPIAKDFHSSSTALEWILSGYPLAISVGLILGGRLGDLVGRRTMFLIGTSGFVAASALCGVAPNEGVLIAARLIQGSFAALMLPQGFGVIREVFPDEERQKAFAIFGPVIGLSAVFGPLIGGSLVDWNLFGYGWRLVFLVNVPIGVAAVIGAMRLLPPSARDRSIKLDLGGAGLVTLFAVLLVYPLIEGREHGWPWWAFASMALGLLLLVVFGLYQRRRDRAGLDPLVTPSVFSHRGYSAGLIFAMVFFAGLGGILLCSTLFLQIGQDYTPIHAALCTVPMSVGLVIGSGLSGGLLGPRFGRLTIQGGVIVGGVGWLLVALAAKLNHELGFVGLMPGLLVAGAGFGLVVAPMFDIVLAAVTDEETGSASGVLNAGQQLATSIGIAVFATVFFDALPTFGNSGSFGAAPPRAYLIGTRIGSTFHSALTRAMLVEAALMAVLFLLAPLMPRFAREPNPNAAH
jgi:EmrB/QacA subfamily drug resistance transporter